MTTGNSTVLLRSLIVYGVCVLLAVVVGYTAADLGDYQDAQSLGMIGFLATILVFPLLMKWHYPLLIFSWNLPVALFFLPGHTNLFLVMVAASLTISVAERILNRNQPFLPTGGVAWPLLALLAVIFITAKLNGGFGLRSMGSSVYGGKKYIYLVAGLLSFFALIARPIPKKHANLYLGLFFAGGLFNVISDLYPFAPSPLRFIFLLFPPSGNLMDPLGNMDIELGVTRLGGISSAAAAVFFWMIARYGFRESLLTARLWRPMLLGLMLVCIMLGGYRSAMLNVAMVLVLLFFLEKLHRTGLMLVVVSLGIAVSALLVPLASRLPFTFQRTLAFLPLPISADARLSAESTSEWRIEMWTALMPQVPKYLMLGKGYAFSAETFDESMGANATFQHIIDAADNPLALSSDFHSGPLSVVLSFGIWGVIAWLWFWAAGFFVVWRNYHYGDPSLQHINLYLFAAFMAKCVLFLFVFGDITGDAASFSSILGLSIAFNHGVMSRSAAPAAKATAASPALAYPIRPAFQR